MDQQVRHGMLPRMDHDEEARQMFVLDFRNHLAAAIAPGTKAVYEARVKPAYERQHGRAPKDRHEVRHVMTKDDVYQFWSAMQRMSQEMVFDTVIDTMERTLPEELERAARLERETGLGSLTLDPALEIPRYHTAADIHLQPGGYHSENVDGDLSAGAIYDRGIYVYSMGGLGPMNDELGMSVVDFYRAKYPNANPTRILDMGCAVGNSTVPWKTAYPDAEVHGIDVGAPVLRYAHARAQSLGAAVHFGQQNAERTRFPDDHFDIVASCIMLHETSRHALPAIFKEARRILKPGGVMIHLEIPQADVMDPYDSFMYDWEIYNNNETFLNQFRETDLPALCREAGFAEGRYRIDGAPSHQSRAQRAYGAIEFDWPVIVAEKSA